MTKKEATYLAPLLQFLKELPDGVHTINLECRKSGQGLTLDKFTAKRNHELSNPNPSQVWEAWVTANPTHTVQVYASSAYEAWGKGAIVLGCDRSSVTAKQLR